MAALGFVVAFTAFSLASACNGPYKVTDSHKTGGIVVLECGNDGDGLEVGNASFYRNGVEIRGSGGPCLNDSIVNTSPDEEKLGKITLRFASECDGYYTCGTGGVLSTPSTVYFDPHETGPGKPDPIHLEEGDSIALPCYVSSSPVLKQRVTWYREDKSTHKLEDHDENESSYMIKNATVDNYEWKYYCVVTFPDINGLSGVSSVNEGKIPVTVHKKFVPPKFNQNSPLTYSIDEAGTAEFKAFVLENKAYSITYQWRINGSNISTDSSMVLIHDFKYGLTQVEVIATNTKYDLTEHSSSQMIYVDRQSATISKLNCTECNETTPQGIVEPVSANDTVLLGVVILLAVIIFILIGVIIILVVWHKKSSHKSAGPRKSSFPDDQPRNQYASAFELGVAAVDAADQDDQLLVVFRNVMDFATNHVKNTRHCKTDTTIVRYLHYFITTVCENEEIDVNPQVRCSLIQMLENVQSMMLFLVKKNTTSTPPVGNTTERDLTSPAPSHGTIAFDDSSSSRDVSKGADSEQREQNGGYTQSKSWESEDNRQKEMLEDILEKLKTKLRQISNEESH